MSDKLRLMWRGKNDLLVGLFFLILSLWVMRVLLQPGFYGSHDGLFLYARTAAMAEELKQGQFPVRVSDKLAFGRGYPVFNYHYPLFFYLSSIPILLGLGVATSMKMVIILATWWSLWATYKWLRCFFDEKASTTGAAIFLLVPYRFLMIFVAGSYGTVLALAMAPTLLWGISALVVKNEKKAWLVSLALAGLITAHNVTTLIFAPVVSIYSLVLLSLYGNGKKFKELFLAGLLGLGISTFFWLPAILEMKLVWLSAKAAVNYQDHFVTIKQLLYMPWGYGYSNPGTLNDGMSFMLGIAQWLVVVTAVVLVVVYKLKSLHKKQEKVERLASVIIEIFVVTLFLMLINSNFVWKAIAPMGQIQFPWRLLAALIVLVSFLAGYVVYKLNNFIVVVFLITLALFATRNLLRPMTPTLEPESKYANDEFLMRGTTDIAWELAPIDVKSTPPQWPDEQGRKFYMPQWEVLVDGEKVETYPDEDGYLAFKETGSVQYRIVSTPIEKMANAISLLSLFLFGIFYYRDTKSAKRS